MCVLWLVGKDIKKPQNLLKVWGLSEVVSLRSDKVAERQGFEPWVPVRVQRFSRPSRSTTPASFHCYPQKRVQSYCIFLSNATFWDFFYQLKSVASIWLISRDLLLISHSAHTTEIPQPNFFQKPIGVFRVCCIIWIWSTELIYLNEVSTSWPLTTARGVLIPGGRGRPSVLRIHGRHYADDYYNTRQPPRQWQ